MKCTNGFSLSLFTSNDKYIAFVLSFATIIASIFIFIIPPFQAPDEYLHFYRAYAVSMGNLFPEVVDSTPVNLIPNSLVNLKSFYDSYGLPFNTNQKINFSISLDQARLITLNPDILHYYSVGNTSLYSPILYFPQAFGCLIGRLLNLPVIYIFFLGRISNYCIAYIFAFFSLKLIPFGKIPILLFTLLPTSLAQKASYSADAMVISLIFFYVSFVISLLSKDQILKRHIIFLFFLSSAVIIAKMAYSPVILLFFLIKPRQFKSSLNYSISLLLSIFVPVLIFTLNSNTSYIEPCPLAHPELQTEFLLRYPQAFFLSMFFALSAYSIEYLRMIVACFGWVDTYIPNFFYLTSLLCFFASLLDVSHDSSESLNSLKRPLSSFKEFWSQKPESLLLNPLIIFTFVITLCCTLVFASMYIVCTPLYYSKLIVGVQGRYFIPIGYILIVFSQILLTFNYDPSNIGYRLRTIPSKILVSHSYVLIIVSAISIIYRYYVYPYPAYFPG